MFLNYFQSSLRKHLQEKVRRLASQVMQLDLSSQCQRLCCVILSAVHILVISLKTVLRLARLQTIKFFQRFIRLLFDKHEATAVFTGRQILLVDDLGNQLMKLTLVEVVSVEFGNLNLRPVLAIVPYLWRIAKCLFSELDLDGTQSLVSGSQISLGTLLSLLLQFDVECDSMLLAMRADIKYSSRFKALEGDQSEFYRI